jgi:hypothetical protein
MAALSHKRADIASIASAVERSPIVIASLAPGTAEHCPLKRHCGLVDLPVGYERADLIILDWIAAEVLRARRICLPL